MCYRFDEGALRVDGNVADEGMEFSDMEFSRRIFMVRLWSAPLVFMTNGKVVPRMAGEKFLYCVIFLLKVAFVIATSPTKQPPRAGARRKSGPPCFFPGTGIFVGFLVTTCR